MNKILIPYNFDNDILFWLKDYYQQNFSCYFYFFPFKYDSLTTKEMGKIFYINDRKEYTRQILLINKFFPNSAMLILNNELDKNILDNYYKNYLHIKNFINIEEINPKNINKNINEIFEYCKNNYSFL